MEPRHQFPILILGVALTTVAGGQPLLRSGCTGSTVDDSASFGPERAKLAKTFLSELQSAVKADDKQKIASMIRFPLRVSAGEAKPAVRNGREVMVVPSRSVANRAQFLAQYPRIITPELKQIILAERAECLFGNYQGAMVGSGDVWFEQFSEGGPFKIFTTHVPETSKRSLPK